MIVLNLAPPPTAQTRQPILLLGTALDTLAQYNYLNGATLAIFEGQKIAKLGVLKVEFQKSPRWRHLYCPKLSRAVPSERLVDEYVPPHAKLVVLL